MATKKVETIYPLSPLQHGMLFDTLYAPGSGVYVEQFHCELQNLNVDAFERAWQWIAERHAVLRTAFVWEKAAEPLQLVGREVKVKVARQDWRERSTVERQKRFEHYLDADRRRGFKLSKAPLMRLVLIQTGDSTYRFVWSYHHLLLDGWSLELLLNELFRSYWCFCQGQTLSLEASWPYQHYINWLQNQKPSEAESFWRRLLKGFTAPTAIGFAPISGSPGAAASYGERKRLMPDSVTRALQALAQQHQLTLNTIVQGTWALLLSRYSGEQDVVFGATVSGRPPDLAGVEHMVGLFINTLPVRARVSADPPLVPWLKALQAQQVELRRYEYSALAQVKKWSEVPAGMHLFETVLVFENYPLNVAALQEEAGEGLIVNDLQVVERTSVPLTAIVVPGPRLHLQLNYDARRFDAPMIERMLDHWQTALTGVAADPSQRLGDISILSEAERRQLVVAWNSTHTPYPQSESLPQLVEAQVERTPDAVAVTFEGQSVTYRQLNVRANRLACALQRLGVAPETLVAICADRSLDMLIGLLAVLKAGGAYVPIDPAYPAERVAFIMADAQAPVLLTQTHLLARLPAHSAHTLCLDGDWGETGGDSSLNPVRRVMSGNLAYLIYTSGSTGVPKGVAITHQSAVAFLSWAQSVFGADELKGVLASTSICFDLSVYELFLPLSVGGTVVLAENALQLPTLAAREQVTLINTVPSAMAELVRQGAVPEGVHTVNLAGEPLPNVLVQAIYAQTRAERVYNLYGPSEDTTYSTYALAARGSASAPPIGRPIANTRAYVLDRDGQPVPVGVVGELYLGGEGLARGYLGRPDLTAERFVPDPFASPDRLREGGRLYRTGDLVRYTGDGTLDYLGRVDHQVKVRGFRIELGEIEAALRRHEDVQDVVVTARESQTGGKRLAAYLVPVSAGALTDARLRSYLQAKLPEYMVPSAFVFLPALPLTPNGKVDRKALPGLEGLQAELVEDYVAPRTAVEAQLAAVWAHVFGMERVGVHDNFFTLGGDSILSIQVVSRASQAGLKVTPRQVFGHPTIEQLARVVSTSATVSAEQGLVAGPVPLTPIQAWFFEQSLPERHHFNQSVLLSVPPNFESQHLQQALSALLVHHDALRLRFVEETGVWRQEHAAPDEGPPLTCVDLSHVSDRDIPAAIEAEAVQLQASLDLSAGPLMRAGYFDLGPDRPGRLLLVVHHLAVDGVSWRILLEDLQTAYLQLGCGETVQLPAKTASFRHWAERLVEHARSAALKAEREYWFDNACIRAVPLPVDYPVDAEANTVASTASTTVTLTAEETRALLQEVPAAYNTRIDDVLLAALAVALSEWTGSRAVQIDLEGHGREDLFDEVDLSRTVGWFTAKYPVRLDLSGATAPEALLPSIKEQLRRIPNRGVGYGLLRYLGRDDGRPAPPDSEVVFNYLGQFDQTLGEGRMFDFAGESTGPNVSRLGRRGHLIDINGLVSDGRLSLTWTFSERVHRAETIGRVARNFLIALRALITHCLSPEAGGYTPSDFPLARLTQPQLAQVIETITPLQGRAAKAVLEDIYPLSPLQQGLLFHSLHSPTMGLYFNQFTYALHGAVNVDAFVKAWQAAVARHPVLRTAFVWEGLDEPLQVVCRDVGLPVEHLDWRGLAPEQRQMHLAAFVEADRRREFEFSRAPLMRLAIIRLADDVYHFIWSHHHLLLDGWSLPVLFQEVLESYEALSSGRLPQVAVRRPFRDHIAWLGEQDLAAAEQFWRAGLAGFTTPTVLGVERASGSAVEPVNPVQTLILTPQLSAGLQAFAQQHQLTLNTLVQGAWALLLGRYSGERDVMFGVTVSGRPAGLSGAETMLGLFINTLPQRVQLPPGASVLSWLHDLQAGQISLQQYDYTPLIQVQKWSEVPRGTPLFDHLFVFENYPVSGLRGGEAGELDVDLAGTIERLNYPLALVVVPGAGLRLKAYYDGRRYEAATITRLLGHLQTLLQDMMSNPGKRLGELSLLPGAEREQLLVAWNATQTPYPRQRSLAELFEAQAAYTPDSVALVFEDIQLTYRELNARADRLARQLEPYGVGPETLVGLYIDRSLEMVIGLLGILKAGGAYVPLDPAYPAERLSFMLDDTRAAVLLTQSHLLDRLPASQHAMPVVCLDAAGHCPAGDGQADVLSRVLPANLAYVIYTSGSTGRPKGVSVSHQNVVRLVKETNYAVLDPDEIFLQLAPLAFDASTFEIWACLLNGARLVIFPPRTPTLEELGHCLQEQQVTTLWLTAGLFHQVVEGQPESIHYLKQLLAGGDVLSVPHVHQALRALKGGSLINGYGPTESTTFTCCHWVTAAAQIERPSLPIGRPIANTQVFVLDRHLQPSPIGVPGELYIGGDGLARGYLNRPDLTAEKFIPNPFDRLTSAPTAGEGLGGRLYKTGDLARRLPNGDIEFLGRMDNQVKVSGFRIELGEIETALNGHPAVQQAIVLAASARGGSEKRLVAYVVPREGILLTVTELRDSLRQQLPEYMVPSAFVFLSVLPLTPNGKVDRRALPDPDGERPELAQAYAAPRTPLEAQLAELWAQVLGVARVGIHDNFFELGGHSLLALQLLGQIRKQFDQALPMAALLEQPTIERLACFLQQTPDALPWSPVVVTRAEGSRAPLFLVSPSTSDVLRYQTLTHCLEDQPLYTLQPPEFALAQAPYPTIEMLAERFVAEIKSIQASGPYRVGGWSFGGLVALEIAQQLRRQADDVELLALFDTFTPAEVQDFDPGQMLASYAEVLGLSIEAGPLNALRDRDEMIHSTLEQLHSAGLLPAGIGLTEVQQLLHSAEVIVHIIRRYTLQPYPGPATFFRAAEWTVPGSTRDPAPAWQPLFAGSLTVETVPGNHGTLFDDPHVETLARHLSACLLPLPFAPTPAVG